MRLPYNREKKVGVIATVLKYGLCAMGAAFLASCGTEISVQRDARETGGPPPLYSIVCIVHGDGEYVYHDAQGNAHIADEQVYAGMERIALLNPRAEVFLFHELPQRRFLLLFPLHDGEFAYYLNGRRVADGSYWRHEGVSRFAPEVDVYRHFRVEGLPAPVRMFLYFGHEIPEVARQGYDASSPEVMCSVQDLAEGLKRFTGSDSRFDMMILATCFGGTPHTIGALEPFARTIVASPGNLHLSYFDLHPLEHLELHMHHDSVAAFAEVFARDAFRRLSEDVQTEVTVAVYDAEQVRPYLDTVRGVYDSTLSALNAQTQVLPLVAQHGDCGELQVYKLPTISEGVKVFYRPAQFGKRAQNQQHSGWECWNVRDPAASRSASNDATP
jgi:hypothetical protein